MKTIFVGLDVSKDDFKAAVKNEENKLIRPVKAYGHDMLSLKAFDKDIESIKKQLGCCAIYGMESTGIFHLSVYQHLLDAGAHVKLFNSLELKRYKSSIRKTKTDDLDAQAIAEALLLVRDASYDPASETELINLRELCRVRARMTKKITQCKNQAIRNMDTLCRGYTNLFSDIFQPSSIGIMKATIRSTRLFKTDINTLENILVKYMPHPAAEKKAELLRDLFQHAVVPEHMKEICIMELHMLIQQYELLKQQVVRIEKRIEKGVKEIDTCIMSIPGIGTLTAGIVLGELGDLSRFTNHNQLTAFAGLDPSIKESGRSSKTGRISKRGSPMLRQALYHAALPASRVNPVCQQLYQRLKAKGKHHKVCMVAVARKLLHIAYSVERNHRDFYVPAYILEQMANSES
ncbi:MAG: IS110 family transposase [Thermodesulfobacteriota bacterium]|nr:IS110 family transposase [Thermodesulfobacteriota bacterium]